MMRRDRRVCVVFDLDDTLFLECDYVRSGFDAVHRWVRRTLGLRDFADRAWALFEDGHRSCIFDMALVGAGLEPSQVIIDQMVRVYRAHRPTISLLPDAADCILRLQDTALLALITDGPTESQRQKVEVLGLEPFFQLIVLAGTWGSAFYKPNPRAFHLVETILQPTDGRYIYVADNPAKDFLAPLALGWDTVRIRRPGGLHFAREAHSHEAARVEVEDLAGLRDIVAERS